MGVTNFSLPRPSFAETPETMAQVGLLDAVPSTVMGAVVNVPSTAAAFFNGDQGLISVWDYDYDAIIGFQTQLQWAQFCFCPPAWISCLCCHPCFLNKKVEWRTRAQHVALTVDGIRYVQDK